MKHLLARGATAVKTTGIAGSADALRLRRSPAAPNGAYAGRFRFLEYLYYLVLFYSVMGDALTLSVGFLGAAMFLALAMFSIMRLGSSAVSAYLSLAGPLLCTVSFITIQLLVHREPLMHEYVRPFVTFWALSLIVIKPLCTRPRFLQRASVAMFLIGLMVLPFLKLDYMGDRAGLEAKTGMGNPNDLGAWFGFCALAFTVRGFESRSALRQWVSWAIAILCLVVLGLTVSRGSLAGYAVGSVLAFRKQLKRGFLPMLAVIGILGTAFAFGLFDRAIAHYTERGMEETGRLEVWPLALQRFLDSPFLGVGVSQVGTATINSKSRTPHNAFLFVALSSGVVPLLFLLLSWIVGLRGALRTPVQNPDSAYLLPFLVYSFLAAQTVNLSFAPWSTISLCLCLPRRGFRFSNEVHRVGREAARTGGSSVLAAPRF